MAAHLHRAHRYQTMAKPDCVYITCRCGEKEAVATWYSPTKEPHPGWDAIHWRLHGYRKVVGCATRWRKYVIRLHQLWDRALARRATKAGRTPDEQQDWERLQFEQSSQAWEDEEDEEGEGSEAS